MPCSIYPLPKYTHKYSTEEGGWQLSLPRLIVSIYNFSRPVNAVISTLEILVDSIRSKNNIRNDVTN